MEKNRSVIDRQNDAEALSLLRASHKCLRTERIIKYLMIALSFGICILAILNRYLPNMFPMPEDEEAAIKLTATLEAARDEASKWINLVSGAIIVASIPLGFHCTRMHTEGTVLRDRYDAYAFDNKPNYSILRPISNTYVDEYSRKVKAPDSKFKNFLYAPDAEIDNATVQFEYIREEAHSDYKLYLYIQPFFITVWLGFGILIIIIAAIFDGPFVDTLINIMIPSLSAITTIGTSWYNCRLQMRQLINLINIVDEIQRMPVEKRRQYISNKQNMRILADGLFNYRSSPFVIPNFLVALYKHSLKKDNKKKPAQTVQNRYEAPASAKKAALRTETAATATSEITVTPSAAKKTASSKSVATRPAGTKYSGTVKVSQKSSASKKSTATSTRNKPLK